MRQLQFSLEDIKSRPISFILIFIQIMFSLLMIAYSSSMIENVVDYKNKFSIFKNSSEMFMIVDNTDDEYFDELWNNQSDNIYKLLELYEFISNNKNINSYSFVTEAIILETNEILDTYAEKAPDNTVFYNLINVDYNFAETFNLECSSGEVFSINDYKTNNERIPTILGSNYQKYYNIGDEIFENHIVTGFLEENSFYLDPKSSGDVIYLNNYIITPMIINEQSDFLYIDNAITRSTILTNNNKELDKITNKSKELGLYDFSYKSYTQQLNDILSQSFTYIYVSLIIVFLVLFFCVICIISSIMNFLETHKKEFSVHLLCGAQKKDFIIRVFYQIAIIIFLGNIVTVAFFGFSLPTLVTVVFSLIVMLIILYLPIVKISNQNVSELLRRSE